MNHLSILSLFLAAVLNCHAITIGEISPHLSTNAQIIWKAPTNSFPKSLWSYKILPNIFSAQLISNAVVLASLERKGIPKPTTNQVVIWDHTRDGDDPLAGSFAILPQSGEIFFNIRNHFLGSSNDIPNENTIVSKAWKFANKLCLTTNELSQGNIEDNECEYDEHGKLPPNPLIGGRTISLVRKLDGVDFQAESEGFWIEFGSHGVIRSFGLHWPNLERVERFQTVSPEQIISFIRANKSPVFPNKDEQTFFQRVKHLSQAKTLTITKITPRYGEGIFDEAPNKFPKCVTPYAEIQALADFGNSNMMITMATPIILYPKEITP